VRAEINGAAEQIVVGEGMNECFSSGARGRGSLNFACPGFQPFTSAGMSPPPAALSCAWKCALDPLILRAGLLRSVGQLGRPSLEQELSSLLLNSSHDCSLAGKGVVAVSGASGKDCWRWCRRARGGAMCEGAAAASSAVPEGLARAAELEFGLETQRWPALEKACRAWRLGESPPGPPRSDLTGPEGGLPGHCVPDSPPANASGVKRAVLVSAPLQRPLFYTPQLFGLILI